MNRGDAESAAPLTDAYAILQEPDAPDWRSTVIEGTRYTAPARLAHEQERVFARTWQLAGRTDQLRAPGDYFTFEVAGESIVVVNAGDAGIRAFYNLCRHRGRRLVDEGSCGQASRFKCPYHNWVYGLDGQLRAVPDADAFRDLDRETRGLLPVHADVWQGLVFVNLEANPEPLRNYLDVLTECMAGAFEPGVLVAARTHEFEANWKTVLEAFIETYHIAGLHPQVAKTLKWKDAAIAHFRRHSMTVVPAPKANRWAERRHQHWREWVADPLYLEYHYTVFPNLSVHVFIRGFTFVFRCLPHPTDVERMRMDVWIWKRLREGETPPPPLAMQDAMIEILEQDYANFASVQRGMRSRAFTGPKLNFYESRIGHFHAVMDAYL